MRTRKKLVSIAFVISFLPLIISAQKVESVFGKFLIGEVVATDDATRTITIKYPDNDASEVFVGTLVAGYKVKMKDGSFREIKVSDITPGTRLRVHYKTQDASVNNKKTKVFTIQNLTFLGKDEYVRMRSVLGLDPETVVIKGNSADFPKTSPVRIFLSFQHPLSPVKLLKRINNWNKKNGDKYGQLELVGSSAESDVTLLVATGADTLITNLPMNGQFNGVPVEIQVSKGTAYLVTLKNDSPKVIWMKVVNTMLSQEKGLASDDVIADELERLMKARSLKP